ncbi:daptide-type RiPP, partial [Motilibacter deserti]
VEELESLEAPGFWEGFAVGSVFAGAVVGGIALT